MREGRTRVPELRAPDPYLTAAMRERGGPIRVLVQADTSVRGGAVAHLPYLSGVYHATRTACGLFSTGFTSAVTRHARWWTVACGGCFPESRDRSDETYLEWQKDGMDRQRVPVTDEPTDP